MVLFIVDSFMASCVSRGKNEIYNYFHLQGNILSEAWKLCDEQPNAISIFICLNIIPRKKFKTLILTNRSYVEI